MSFEIILLGDSDVGKSAFVERHLTGKFVKDNIADIGVDLCSLNFNTNYGPITFNVWNHAGQENFKGLHESYYKFANAALIMFDVTDKNTYKGAKKWINDFTTKGPKVPILICGNKNDLLKGNINYSNPRNDYTCYNISVKTNYNVNKPFLDLARILTGHNDLIFIETSDDLILIESSDEESDTEPNSELTHITWIDLPDGGQLKITHEYYPRT